MLKNKPLVLLILDGWGAREDTHYNAIAAANTPQWDTWWNTCPHALLYASGEYVGLPDNQMGNSEVGHMHIGAGRTIEQDFTRINNAILSGEFFQNRVLLDAIHSAKQQGKAIHVMGLLSPGGVHSHEQHLFAFIKLCKAQNFEHVFLHLFLDGRDTPPKHANVSVDKLMTILSPSLIGHIKSISGRYYAMDRDKRWERIESVYTLLTENISESCFDTVKDALNGFYNQGISDEFIPPTRIGSGRAIESGDVIFFFNFRADRARQLTHAFINKEFTGFERRVIPTLSQFITMTQYEANMPVQNVFPPMSMKNTLGEVIAKHGLRQLRMAETEKYAHVTFFFNGGSECVYPNEDRLLIASPRVATYDLKPEMSALELTHALVNAIQKHTHDVIICNYANADMVGHTGNFKATIKAVECLDNAMHNIGQALQKTHGKLLITSDHGNAETMFDETTQQVQTAHTSQPVPLLFVGGTNWTFYKRTGSLIDIAPTVLALLNIKKPKEMEGENLLTKQCGKHT